MQYKADTVKIVDISVTTVDVKSAGGSEGQLVTQVWGLGDDNEVYFYEPGVRQWRPYT